MPRKSKHDYDVGYGKPPVVHRYPPGYSGNLNGRPKRKPDEDASSNTLFSSLKNSLNRRVTVTEGGRQKRVTLRDYLIAKQIQAAIKDPKMLANFLKMIERADLADLEGKTGEPMVLHIIGGLPEIDRRYYGKQ